MTPVRISPWWRPRTLSRQLMYGVSALVTVVVFGIGVFSVYNLHTYVTANSDAELTHSLAAFEHFYDKAKAKDAAGLGVPDDDKLTDYTGQASGTLIALLRGSTVADSAIFSDAGSARAPASAVATIADQDWSSGGPRTLKLDGLGNYRMASHDLGDGQRLVSGVSMESANKVVATKSAFVILITIAAAVLAALGTAILLRWALRPLRRVAATAAKAARMPLAEDDQRITARVKRADSDPDNEVGIVGETLNRLLANVDAALAARAASDRRMRRFLTDASHELRTPLTAIQGYAQLTRQESDSLPPMTEYALGRIESEARRMTDLVTDMLLLSRLDEGQGLEVRRIDLRALVFDAVNDAEVSDDDHRWLTDLPDDAVWVMGDQARLHQVVSNLLANARHHTPPGVTVTTTLRVLDLDEGPHVSIVVADDGPGIDPKLLPELFGRFVRGDRSRSSEVTSNGLGLAIVASITEAHGGTVGVTSRAGKTEFRVLLPTGASVGNASRTRQPLASNAQQG
ncbi:sensor histidine kinase [Mycolicibacterium madagascariense]|nr:HAMP domain-containing sensor histidine kinase [Mycolicibacterium madagascariense]